jgi:uracil-DNA glycosylase
MAYSHVLGSTNGPLDARVLIVGEAPGRLGAARTGVPFRGDQSGQRLERLLEAARLTREEVFVTNALLCNPLDGGAHNRRPRASELAACAGYLERTLDLVRAPVVVALGGVALVSLDRVASHGVVRISEAAGRPVSWHGRTLVPLVHPSPRTQGRRSWERQLEDWRVVGQLVKETRSH